MHRTAALQQQRLCLRRLRKCFNVWSAAMRLQRSVLQALSLADAHAHTGAYPPPQFVRVRPHAQVSAQTDRPCCHPSLPVVLHRLALRSLLPLVCTWRQQAVRSRALRWGRKRTCARAMMLWAERRKHAVAAVVGSSGHAQNRDTAGLKGIELVRSSPSTAAVRNATLQSSLPSQTYGIDGGGNDYHRHRRHFVADDDSGSRDDDDDEDDESDSEIARPRGEDEERDQVNDDDNDGDDQRWQQLVSPKNGYFGGRSSRIYSAAALSPSRDHAAPAATAKPAASRRYVDTLCTRLLHVTYSLTARAACFNRLTRIHLLLLLR